MPRQTEPVPAASGPPLAAAAGTPRFVHVPIEQIFEALTEPALLRRWLAVPSAADVTVEAKVGGTWTIGGAAVATPVQGLVAEVRYPDRLRVTWTDGALDVTLQPGLGGTTVVLTSVGSPLLDGAAARLAAWFGTLAS